MQGWDDLKEDLYMLLVKYSIFNKIFYYYEIELARKHLGLDSKTARILLVELFMEGKWTWDGDGTIKLL